MKKRSKLAFYIFSLIAFISIFIYFLIIRKDIALVKKIGTLWLVLTIIAQSATYLFSAVIYHRILKILQPATHITVWQLYQANIVAQFANQVIPVADISGNIFLYNFLKRKEIAATAAVSVITVELLVYYSGALLVILWVLGMCVLWLQVPSFFFFILVGGLFMYMLFTYGILLLERNGRGVVSRLEACRSSVVRKYATGLGKFVNEALDGNFNSLAFIREHRYVMMQLCLLEAATMWLDSVTIYILFRGLGIFIPYESILTAYVLTKIISLLPVSPGALIIYESSLCFFLIKMGVPAEPSIIVTLLFRVISFWLPMPAGFVLAGKFHHRL